MFEKLYQILSDSDIYWKMEWKNEYIRVKVNKYKRIKYCMAIHNFDERSSNNICIE